MGPGGMRFGKTAVNKRREHKCANVGIQERSERQSDNVTEAHGDFRAFDPTKDCQSLQQAGRAGNVLIEAFYRAEHLNVAASRRHEVDDDAGTGVLVGLNSWIDAKHMKSEQRHPRAIIW